ncbi:adenylyl-sulfate kinase [Mucilaginibacter sp. AW1-3]
MITDLVLKLYKLDPLIKRNVLKTVSWRIIGSIDTVVLGWFITGNLSFGLKIGGTELLTKMLLYYGHERFWQGIKLGLPSRKYQNQLVKKENKEHLFKQTGRVTRQHREELNNNPAFTLWLTGLSGSGKSTVANELELWMFEQGMRVYILDGDNTRLGINSDLTFSDDDRAENIRRVAEICKLFNDAGTVVIASFISPFINDRLLAKNLVGADSFIEVYTDSSVETCQRRDTKGLYKLAVEGKLKNFTGISSPYEAPVQPDIHLQTDNTSVDDCLAIVKKYLVSQKKISAGHVWHQQA